MKLSLGQIFLLSIYLTTPAAFAQNSTSCTEALSSLMRSSSSALKELNVAHFPKMSDTKHLSNDLLFPSGKILNEFTKNPELEMSYVITPDDRMFLIRGLIDFDGNYKYSAELVDDKGTPLTFPVKAAGQFKLSSEEAGRKGFFNPVRSYGAELTDEEIGTFSKQVEGAIAEDSSLAKKFKLKRPNSTARLMKCSEAISHSRSSKKFISAKLATSMSLLTGGILIQNPDRFDVLLTQLGFHQQEEGRNYDGDMLFTDYLTTGSNSLFQGLAGYHISTKGVQFLQSRIGRTASSMVSRGAVSLTSIGMQTLLYATLTDNNAKGVGIYNIGYSAFSIAKSHFFDDFLVHKLPELVTDACMVNPAFKIVVGDRSIRLGEGLASTWLYLTGRHALVGE